MKISVSARGESLDSDVDPRFGGSSGFILFDSETGNASYLDNSAQRDLARGTGVKTAQMIADAGSEVLITGQLGPKAAQVLSKSKVKVYACTSGTVREAIKALEEEKLKELSADAIQLGPGKMGGRGVRGGGRGRGASKGGRGEGGGSRGRGPGGGRGGQGGP
jgi:predicted Fe-Mo cluster-binding NifX family protein